MDFTAVTGFQPAFFADESDRARSSGLNPAWTLFKRLLKELDFQHHAVCIETFDPVFFRSVLDRHGIVRLVGHLAQIDSVSSPIQPAKLRGFWVVTQRV